MKKKKKVSIKFVGRKQSIYGLVSTIIGGIGVLALAVMFYISTVSEGTTSMWIGLAGLLLLVITLAGFILGMTGFKQKDIFYTLPVIGVSINGILFLGMVVLYFLGLSVMTA